MNLQTAELNIRVKGSTSATPDLDWSQVRETVKMLNLAVAQVGGSLMHGNDSVNELTDSFTSMADAVNEIRSMIKDVNISQERQVLGHIDEKCGTLSDKVSGAIIAFQFYDRLSQNLTHVNECLSSLSELVADQTKLYNPSEWMRLQDDIRGRYTMSEEREMFDMVLEGADLDKILEKFKSNHNEDIGEIELF